MGDRDGRAEAAKGDVLKAEDAETAARSVVLS